eukprot:ANDGO_00876.mRNA.1 transmembrane protein 181
MDPNRVTPFKLETFSSFKTICVFVLYICIVGFAILIGVFGPAPFESKSFLVQSTSDTYAGMMRGYEWSKITLGSFEKLNQQWAFSFQFARGNGTRYALSADIPVTVSIYGGSSADGPFNSKIASNTTKARTIQCNDGASSCERVDIAFEPFLEYSHYQVWTTFGFRTLDTLGSNVGDLTFKVSYYRADFSVFQIGFRYSFLVFNLLSLFYTSAKLWKYRHVRQTEQKWILFLLIALIGFNNPFFAANFFVEGFAFPILDIFLIVNFVCSLLLFWLVMLNMVYVPPSRRGFFFYAPKIFLMLLIFAFVTAWYIMERYQAVNDPTTDSAKDSVNSYVAIRVIGIILAFIYVFYLMYSVFRAVGASAAQKEAAKRRLRELKEQHKDDRNLQGNLEDDEDFQVKVGMRRRFKALFGLSFIVFMIVVGGLIFSVYVTRDGNENQGNSATFLVFWTVINLYVYVLAYFYLPSKRKAHKDYGQTPGMVAQITDTGIESPSDPSSHASARTAREENRGLFVTSEDPEAGAEFRPRQESGARVRSETRPQVSAEQRMREPSAVAGDDDVERGYSPAKMEDVNLDEKPAAASAPPKRKAKAKAKTTTEYDDAE